MKIEIIEEQNLDLELKKELVKKFIEIKGTQLLLQPADSAINNLIYSLCQYFMFPVFIEQDDNDFNIFNVKIKHKNFISVFSFKVQ